MGYLNPIYTMWVLYRHPHCIIYSQILRPCWVPCQIELITQAASNSVFIILQFDNCHYSACWLEIQLQLWARRRNPSPSIHSHAQDINIYIYGINRAKCQELSYSQEAPVADKDENTDDE